MASYTTARKASRKIKLENQKNAIKQLNNFGEILQNMDLLNKEIENYNGIITESKLNEICNLINIEKRLKLTEDQIAIVTKKYI